jgi:hypothetical protein
MEGLMFGLVFGTLGLILVLANIIYKEFKE